jgi:hypothetical protein
MRAIEAKTFSGYGGLRQIEMPKPQPAKDRVLVRLTAAGVTPLDHTILSGGHPRAKAPLVLGNEGAGVIEDGGDSDLAVGNRVMFTGPYGVTENGAWQEWLLVKPEHLALVPEAVDDVVARCDRPNLEARADGRLLFVRPTIDRDHCRLAGHHPADRQRIGQADRRARLSARRGGRSLTPSN